MILFITIAEKKRLKIHFLHIINIVIPCFAILLRFLPFMIYFGLSGELVYWTYIMINEISFMFLNIILIILSIYYLEQHN